MRKISEVKGYEHVRDIYFITEDGRIISYGNYGSDVLGEAKELKLYEKTGGYLNCCMMTNDSKPKYFRVHRIVASAYVDNPMDKPYVNHVDEDRQNNHYSNLEWVTPRENNHHSLIKIMYVYDLNGNFVKEYSYTGECEVDGFNSGHACAVARGVERQHKNHIFSYTKLTKEEITDRLSKPFYPSGRKKRK